MGQAITLLITKENIQNKNIPSEQIYFKENGYYIFPLNIDGYKLGMITNALKKFETFREIDENNLAFSDDIIFIISLIKSLKIKTFLLEHYAELGDVPYDWNILIVKNDKIFTQNDYDSIEDILGYFTDEYDNNINIDRFRNFEACENIFKNSKSV